jgi:hypothetical protein
LPLIRFLFSRTYFEGFDMGRFDLIGQYSDRESTLKRLSERIGVPLDCSIAENVTSKTQEMLEAFANQALRRTLEDILAEDIRFFERHAR